MKLKSEDEVKPVCCPTCKYQIHGPEAKICSECGSNIQYEDLVRRSALGLPWERDLLKKYKGRWFLSLKSLFSIWCSPRLAFESKKLGDRGSFAFKIIFWGILICLSQFQCQASLLTYNPRRGLDWGLYFGYMEGIGFRRLIETTLIIVAMSASLLVTSIFVGYTRKVTDSPFDIPITETSTKLLASCLLMIASWQAFYSILFCGLIPVILIPWALIHFVASCSYHARIDGNASKLQGGVCGALSFLTFVGVIAGYLLSVGIELHP